MKMEEDPQRQQVNAGYAKNENEHKTVQFFKDRILGAGLPASVKKQSKEVDREQGSIAFIW